MKLILSRRVKYLVVEPKLFLFAGMLTALQGLLEMHFNNNINTIILLIAAMTLDLITGVRKAIINRTAIVSRGLRKSVDKSIQYFCFLCLVLIYCIAHVQLFPSHKETLLWLPKIYIIYLILIELKSVAENLRGNEDLPVGTVIDMINRFLAKLNLRKNNTNTNNK